MRPCHGWELQDLDSVHHLEVLFDRIPAVFQALVYSSTRM